MKTFIITYNHIVFKPSNYDIFKQQQLFKLEIQAENENEAKEILKTQHNKNPFYFNIHESKEN